MTRELIDRIPESEIVAAQRAMEQLARHASFRAAVCEPLDDEPVTQGDTEANEAPQGSIQAGRVVSHEGILSEFGIR
jgi:hypothetical protein